MDEISRIVSQIDAHLSKTHGARPSTIKCDFVPARSGKIFLRSFGSVSWLTPPPGWFAPGQPGADPEMFHPSEMDPAGLEAQCGQWGGTRGEGWLPSPGSGDGGSGMGLGLGPGSGSGSGARTGQSSREGAADGETKHPGGTDPKTEELALHLAEELSRAQDALLHIQQGKYEAEQQHKEAMGQVEERIVQIEQNNSERIRVLELELDRRASMIDRLSEEMTQACMVVAAPASSRFAPRIIGSCAALTLARTRCRCANHSLCFTRRSARATAAPPALPNTTG